MNHVSVAQCASVRYVRPQDRFRAVNGLKMKGRYVVEYLENGIVLATHDIGNGVVNEGKDKLLDTMFNDDTKIALWYLGLIDATAATLAAGDTYAGIDDTNGWTEFTDYTDPANTDSALTRPEWTVGAASGQAVTNSSFVNFDITDTGSVHGLFLVGGGSAPETKGDNAGGGLLWATAPFTGGNQAVTNGGQLRVTYTVSA